MNTNRSNPTGDVSAAAQKATSAQPAAAIVFHGTKALEGLSHHAPMLLSWRKM